MPDQNRIAIKGNGGTEFIISSCAFAGRELLLLAPRPSPVTGKHVSRAGIVAGAVVVLPRPDHSGVANQCNGFTEIVTSCTVAGEELVLEGPCSPVAGEHVGHARVGRIVVGQFCPDQNRIAVQRYRHTELVIQHTVAGQ